MIRAFILASETILALFAFVLIGCSEGVQMGELGEFKVVAVSSSSITLAWSPVRDVGYYTIAASQDSLFGVNTVQFENLRDTFFVHDGLQPNQRWFYDLCAFPDGDGMSKCIMEEIDTTTLP